MFLIQSIYIAPLVAIYVLTCLVAKFTVLHVLENLSGIFGFRSELGKWPYVRRLKICTPSGYARCTYG